MTRYFEDFAVGETIELGSVTVTQDEIIAFARQYDPQPFHVDPEAAKSSFFGGLVASGWHTGSLFMRLFADAFLSDTVSLGSPGAEELRWTVPVRPGDTLRATYTVLEARTSASRPGVGIVRGRSEARNQHDEVVMTFTGTGFFGRRPG